jgi:hypothetical protein
MGITQQRIIDLTNAVLTWQKIFKETIRRISLAHDDDPDNGRLLALSAMKPVDLADDPDEYLTAVGVLARELENIRITKAKNLRRHFRAPHHSVPDMEVSESLMEKRGRAFREKYGKYEQAELTHTSNQPQEFTKELVDPFSSTVEKERKD